MILPETTKPSLGFWGSDQEIEIGQALDYELELAPMRGWSLAQVNTVEVVVHTFPTFMHRMPA